jgi:hypothetical protein
VEGWLEVRMREECLQEIWEGRHAGREATWEAVQGKRRCFLMQTLRAKKAGPTKLKKVSSEGRGEETGEEEGAG